MTVCAVLKPGVGSATSVSSCLSALWQAPEWPRDLAWPA
jgi:hypothetical protein